MKQNKQTTKPIKVGRITLASSLRHAWHHAASELLCMPKMLERQSNREASRRKWLVVEKLARQ